MDDDVRRLTLPLEATGDLDPLLELLGAGGSPDGELQTWPAGE